MPIQRSLAGGRRAIADAAKALASKVAKVARAGSKVATRVPSTGLKMAKMAT